MDGRQFAKLCKDTKLIGGGFTTTDVDLIFAKVKDKGARKISFEQFDDALNHIGAKKGKTGYQIAGMLIKAGGPKWSGTKAEANRLHDDKDAYTGVHAQGGPSTVDKGHDLADLADRSEANVRGIKKSPSQISKDTNPKQSPSKKSLVEDEEIKKSPSKISQEETPLQSPSKKSLNSAEEDNLDEGLEEQKISKDASVKDKNQEKTET